MYYSRKQYNALGELNEADCFFCKIVSGVQPGLIRYDDEVGVYKSTKPYGKIHYLAFPMHHHIKNCVNLEFTPQNDRLYRKMVDSLRKQLAQLPGKNQEYADSLTLHFHYPPLLSIDHLHLHAIDDFFTTLQWWKEAPHRVYHFFHFMFW
jgi:diadenosine tetraphosphate (Ap4A) HIT family hydrolase